MSIKKIKDSELQENSVASLPSKPSTPSLYAGKSMTAQELKEAFDRLPRLLAERYNALLDGLGLLEEGEAETVAALLATGIQDGHSLEDLFRDIENGNFALYLQTDSGTLQERLHRLVGRESIGEGGEIFNAYTGETANTAEGSHAHAEGLATAALGDYSHAEGFGSLARADYSHVGGKDSRNFYHTIGSFVHGEHLIGARQDQVVFGSYNQEDGSALFIIGNGFSEEERNNILMFRPDGHFYINGVKQEKVADHNESTTAHEDIRAALEEVRALAAGATQATVFASYWEMEGYLAGGELMELDKAKEKFPIGSHIYLQDTSWSDVWVCGYADTFKYAATQPVHFPAEGTILHLGWLLLSPMEGAKLDLSGIVHKAEMDYALNDLTEELQEYTDISIGAIRKQISNIESVLYTAIYHSGTYSGIRYSIPIEALPYAEIQEIYGYSTRNTTNNTFMHSKTTHYICLAPSGLTAGEFYLPTELFTLPDYGMGIWYNNKMRSNRVVWRPDEKKKEYHHLIQKIALTGEENYTELTFNGQTSDLALYASDAADGFTYAGAPILSPEHTNDPAKNTPGNVYVGSGPYFLRFCVSRAEFPTAADFKKYLKERFMQGNPLELLVERQVEEVIDISHILSNDNFIKVARQGAILPKNPEGQAVHTTITFMFEVATE